MYVGVVEYIRSKSNMYYKTTNLHVLLRRCVFEGIIHAIVGTYNC